MEIQFPLNFTIILLVSSFIFIIIKEWKKTNSFKKYKNSAPSPSKLPIIGHLHYLYDQLPHHAFRTIEEKYGSIVQLQLGEVSTVVISSREAAKEVLKVQDPSCANRPKSICCQIMWYDYIDIVFSPCNDYWKQMRKICISEMLRAKNVKSFGSIREDEVSNMIKSIQTSSSSGEAINVTYKIFALTSSIICRATFGKVSRDRDLLISLLKEAFPMAGGFELADIFPSYKIFHFLSWNRYKLLRMRRDLDSILDTIVEEHKLKQNGEFGGEDIIDVFLRMQKDGEMEFPIANNNIKAIIFDMFSAGSETSSTLLDWAMAELMRNPHVMAKVQEEIREAFNGNNLVEENDVKRLKYLKWVIKETMRLHPPVPLLPRACKDECIVDGYTIPIKSRVLVNVWSMARNPKYWDEPERFHPDRFENNPIDYLGNDYEFLPFGSGKRICPGMNLGLANIDFPLAQLLYHFDWKMPQGMTANDIDMSETIGLISSRKKCLMLVPTIYKR